MIPFALVLVLVCWSSVPATKVTAQDDANLNVYIRAQEATHGPKTHNYPAFLKQWTQLLSNRGITVDGSLDFPDEDRLSKADVLIFYCQNSIQNNRQKKLLDRFMNRGGDLVFLHSAVVSNDPSWLKNRIGGAWDDSKYSTDKQQGMYFTSTSHPIIKGVGDFLFPREEVYWDLKLHDDINTLAESFHDPKIIAPQMWTYKRGDSRTFTWLAGHWHTNLNLTHARALVLRGLAWAAGQDVDKYLTNKEKQSLRYPEGGPVEPEKAAESFELHPGFDASLVAAEPNVVNPIDLFFDGNGRMWVAETPEYPQVRDPENPQDRVSIFTDTDGDGRVDQKNVFYEGLELVTSILPYKDGVLAAAAPDLWWIRDTDGDGKADKKERVLTGFGTGDTHAVVNHLRWGLNGWVYATLGYSEGELRDGKNFGQFRSGVIRFRPDGSMVQQVSQKGGNTWGLGFTSDGELLWSQATSGRHIHHTVMPLWALKRGRVGETNSYSFPLDKYIDLHPAMTTEHPAYVQVSPKGGFTAGAGTTPYTGGAWPEEHRNSVFVSEPTLWLTHRDKIQKDGVTYSATPDRKKKEFMASTDLWHLPNTHRVGPDGALYISDMYCMAVSHNDIRVGGKYHGPNNQAIRPDRDRSHGRIWRVQHEDARSFDQPDLGSAGVNRWVDALGHPNQWFRMTSQRLLVEGNDSAAAEAIRERLASGDTRPEFRVHALWTLEQMGELSDEQLINGIHDDSVAVRKNALQVVSNRSFVDRNVSSDVRSAVLQHVDADNPQVQLDALTALGSTGVKATGASKLLSVYPKLDNNWSRSAVLGALKQSPGWALQRMRESGIRPDELYDPVLQAYTNKIPPGEIRSLLVRLSRKSDRAKSKEQMLRHITRMDIANRPQWTEELTAAFRRLLDSENAGVVSATVALIYRWEAEDRFDDPGDRLGNPVTNGLVFHLTPSTLGAAATLKNAEASGVWTDEVPGHATSDAQKSMQLDGEDDVVELSHLGFSEETSITVSSWVKVHSDAGNRNNLFGFGNAGEGSRVFSLRTKGDGGWRLYFWGNDLDASTQDYYGTWTHVTALYNTSLDRRAIYVNGQKVAEDAPSDPDFPDRNYRIGGFNNEHFQGLIHDLRVYNRALSSTEIQQLVQ